MAHPIRVSSEVRVPAAAIQMRAARSSGPGGQNVNKVASKVELRVDLSRIEGLTPTAHERLLLLTANRRDALGFLVVTSQRTRDQSRNLEDAREKVRALLLHAMAVPRPRRPTAATAASRRRRLEEKKRSASRKRARGRVDAED